MLTFFGCNLAGAQLKIDELLERVRCEDFGQIVGLLALRSQAGVVARLAIASDQQRLMSHGHLTNTQNVVVNAVSGYRL